MNDVSILPKNMNSNSIEEMNIDEVNLVNGGNDFIDGIGVGIAIVALLL